MAESLRKSELGSDSEIEAGRISEGNFGVVYRLDRFRLGDDPTPLAYKEFTKDVDEQVRSASRAVAFRDSLSSRDQEKLDIYTAWPRAIVGGDPSGLVMPLIPTDYFRSLIDDETGLPVLKPLAANWLVASSNQITAAGLDLRDVTRLEREMLLAKLCYAIGRLHRHGWVFGDVSLTNAVFALNPPRLMLVDCDAAAPESDGHRRQGHTPFYEPPECMSDPTRLQDAVTDVYKLGLCILRCLSHGKSAGTTRNTDRLIDTYPPEFVDIIGRALASDRAMRPTAKDLYVCLVDLVEERIEIPEVDARMERTACLRGQDVRLDWRISGAENATIWAANNFRVTVDLSAHPDGYSFRPLASGPVRLTAGNEFGGTVEVDLGHLELFEIPPFTPAEIHLPPVSFTPLPAFASEQLPAVTRRPLVSIGDPARPDPISLAALVDSSAHLGTPSGTSMSGGAVEAATALTSGVTDAAGRLTSDMLSLVSESASATLRDLETVMRREAIKRRRANEAHVRGF